VDEKTRELVERLREFHAPYPAKRGVCIEAADAIEALARDAGRYRWLRDHDYPGWDLDVGVFKEQCIAMGSSKWVQIDGTAIDTAIDAGIKADAALAPAKEVGSE
jgi:hypothetical protein